ncbi:hypothetical protein [Paraburkholderia fynbosensis]|uniref:Uncharacterized protein n=1 Tax=Paraburkholderia fynbosensis TaxID=1200993 RepID=A0A6J5FYW5_9BURK|nr:hypothetical protein [Paraburkholderia fynbosensis]CAB3788560.1 hypothetical protein LMG27177_02439 [Paraburkholderia fynbosensis]
MTDIALARKDACLAMVHAVLTDLIDDDSLIDGALRIADYDADDLEGKITETDAVLLAVAALTKINRAACEWSDVDGNPMDAIRVADFVVDEQMNGYDRAANPHETTSSAAKIQARAAAVIRPMGSPVRPVHH